MLPSGALPTALSFRATQNALLCLQACRRIGLARPGVRALPVFLGVSTQSLACCRPQHYTLYQTVRIVRCNSKIAISSRHKLREAYSSCSNKMHLSCLGQSDTETEHHPREAGGSTQKIAVERARGWWCPLPWRVLWPFGRLGRRERPGQLF